MRILTVCSSYRVFGAEIITLKMLEGFKNAGHAQLAITSIWTDGEFSRRLAETGVTEKQLPFGALSIRLRLEPMLWTVDMVARLPSLWKGWRQAVRDFQPDVILFSSWRHPLAVYPWLGKTPAFLIEHANLDFTKTRHRLYALLARRLSGFIAVSQFTGCHLSQFGIPPEKIHVIQNGRFSRSDISFIESTATPVLLPDRKPCVGIVGQICPSKGHGILLEAMNLLRKENIEVDTRAFGTGDPSYVGHLSEKIQEYGLANSWRWMGYETRLDFIYRDLDICVVPSASEAFSLVAAEAGAFARPVVASRVGGVPEVVLDGETGLLVKPGDARELATKIRWLLENPEIARQMGVAGRERVFANFSQEKMVSELVTLFSDGGRPVV